MDNQSRVRELLIEQFDGRHAHVTFEQAVEGLSNDDMGIRPEGLPHSVWELAEHIRIAQYDIVDFSRNPDYESLDWPDAYWPPSAGPSAPLEWEQTLQSFQDDHKAMIDIIKNTDNNLLTPIAHGDGQTLFQEAMLIVDHNAYHIGQIIQVRRLLDDWKSG